MTLPSGGGGRRFAALNVVQEDAGNMRFESGSFDTVVDTFGLCSYEDPVAAGPHLCISPSLTLLRMVMTSSTR